MFLRICVKFIYLLLLSTFVIGTAEFKCKLRPPQNSTKPDSSVHIQSDLLSFLKNHGIYGTRFSYNAKDNVVYEVLVCGDADPAKPNATIIRRVTSEGSESVTAIGLRNATQVTGDEGSWVMLNFNPGDKGMNEVPNCKQTRIRSSLMIICDRKYPKGNFLLVSEDKNYCQYVFELRTAAVCGPPAGMSGFSIFLILLLVGVLLYFVVGFLYLRLQKGAKGIDQFPNREFWFACGNKLADGCGAVCRCDQYCADPIDRLDTGSNQYSDGGYSPISGISGDPATITPHMDRDTTLLNP